MVKQQQTYRLHNIEYRIVYSRRRTLGISVLPDSSVVVRAPLRSSLRTISRIVQEKEAWIIKHRDEYRKKDIRKLNSSFISGETQLFRGKELVLEISESKKQFIRFSESAIELGLESPSDPLSVKRLIYKGFTVEALKVYPEKLASLLKIYENQSFKPTGLTIRSMRSRWGSCSKQGRITLSTELIKLPDIFLEYVIIHELCHLKHHNHGKEYYTLLSELFPDWKKVRKGLRDYIH
jgi:predicted metal-dependent hydrolase